MVEDDRYEIPSEEIRQNRKLFYSLRRECDERLKSWLDRVQTRSNCCKFVKFANFLVIDKFTCGLKDNEMKLIESSSTWTLAQLEKYLSNEVIQAESMNANSQGEQQEINPNEQTPFDIVKCEPVSVLIHPIHKRRKPIFLASYLMFNFNNLFDCDTSTTMTTVQTMRVMKVQMKRTP